MIDRLNDGPFGVRLLRLAREVIGFRLGLVDRVDRDGLDEDMFRQRLAAFVTLKIDGALRGCIGHLEPVSTLVDSIESNAINAAFNDHRFSPLAPEELDRVRIDISVLTRPSSLEYVDGQDLVDKLRPGIDGVILASGHARATFLPQVWEQLPVPESFLDHLCSKAGLGRSFWKDGHPDILIYQVVCFEE